MRQEREDLARRHVNSAETWLRKIVHYQMSLKYGPDFLTTEGLIKKPIREYVEAQRAAKPGKFPRAIDATTFDQAIEIVTNPKFFDEHFKLALREAYPLGHEEARNFLIRLRDIRNDVSHGRGCSARQLEQAICYSNDLIDSLKTYFGNCGMQKTFNVPSITRFTDNLGNQSLLHDVPEDVNRRIIDWRQRGKGDLHPGDTLVAEIEIDPSFDPGDYQVSWNIFAHEAGSGTVARIELQNRHVGEQFELRFTVVSARDWHRFYGCDDALHVIYRVLPPVA